MREKFNSLGFTLIELLIAIALIGILAAIILPSYSGHLERGRGGEALGILGSIAKGEEAIFSSTGQYLNVTAPPVSTAWLQLGIDDPNNRNNRFFDYQVIASPSTGNQNDPLDQYCIVATRCDGTAANPPPPHPNCNTTSASQYAGADVCLDSSGEYFGNNPTSPDERSAASGGCAGILGC